MVRKPRQSRRVTIEQPETMNLLGLLIRDLLASNMQKREKRARAFKLRGALLIEVSRMMVTLNFNRGRVTILRGSDDQDPKARVKASMETIVGIVTGGGVLKPYLKRQIKIVGNPFFVLRVLPLMRA